MPNKQDRDKEAAERLKPDIAKEVQDMAAALARDIAATALKALANMTPDEIVKATNEGDERGHYRAARGLIAAAAEKELPQYGHPTMKTALRLAKKALARA